MRIVNLEDANNPYIAPGLEDMEPFPRWYIDLLKAEQGRALPAHINGGEPGARSMSDRDEQRRNDLLEANPGIARRARRRTSSFNVEPLSVRSDDDSLIDWGSAERELMNAFNNQ